MRVVIAGGGVAGLEAVLALRDLAGDRVEITLISPTGEFVYRPMLVAEPFGTARALRLDLEPLLAETETRHVADSVVGVDLATRSVTTGSGELVDYDALLIALGTRPAEAIPGALTFDGSSSNRGLEHMLRMLGSRHLRRVAFVVPPQPSWTIAAYELALMTAAERDQRRIPELELSLVTHERAPLGLFGSEASRLVDHTMRRAGVDLRTSARAERFANGRLELAGTEEAPGFDQVVALPALTVPEITGLPQRAHGFVGIDAAMHVEGLPDVWAAGDATSFSVKHGGISSQQADVAAGAIAARAGAKVAIEPFRPVLRGAVITGDTPDFLEAELYDPGAGVASAGRPLWTPSIKLAARYLGPYIARTLRGGESMPAFADVDRGPATSAGEGDPRRAVAAALAAADEDAERGDYEGALRWMSLIEQMDLAVPAAYVSRREAWRRELDSEALPHPAAGRIDPAFATPEQAISDLRRRIGWLREAEKSTGAKMESRLSELEAGIEDVVRLSRRTGTLGR
jgi:sulfide:quinone oxidoreductase